MFPRLNLRLEKLLSKGLKSRDSDIRALLLIGLYQLEFMRIPEHAVVDQTVAATEALGKKWAKGLVNAVLRNAQRQSAAQDESLDKLTAYSSIHPQWLIEQWQSAWPDYLQDIIDAGNQYPPMSLRVNTHLGKFEDYCQILQKSDIGFTTSKFSPTGLILSKSTPVEQLPGFHEGLCSVQDEAAQLCAPLLDLKSGQRVLDACAAPGGKTGHLLETCPDIELTAMDISSKRLEDVASNLERLGLQANLIAEDAANTEKWRDGTVFDRILLDVPCSGTGVIRRHPDIKVLRRPSDIDSFRQQQQRLLESLWPLLKEDGLLLYVTCSIMPAENEEQIAAFVAKHEDIESVPIEANWGIPLPIGRQLLPGVDGPDGFYYVLLKKKGKG